MAKNKGSFIAYCDWVDTFDALPDDKAGQLMKHILHYVNDDNPETDDILINAVFAGFKTTLNRDLSKYKKTKERRAEAGKKGGKAKAEAVAAEEPLEAPTPPAGPQKTFKETLLEQSVEVQESFIRTKAHFPEKIRSKLTLSAQLEWLKTFVKLVEERSIVEVEGVVSFIRGDPFHSKNFQSLTKLKRRNPDKILYIDYYLEQMPQQQKFKRTPRKTLER